MVSILDCTMRDGGYYNDWDFSDEFVQAYFDTMGALGVTHVEVGFRFLNSKTHSGAWAYSPDEKIADFNLPRGVKVGVMVNLAEFKSPESLIQLSKMFPPSRQITFVRVACHFEELQFLKPVVEYLKSLGLDVGVNLMQVSERSEAELLEFIDIGERSRADFLYVADSLGSLSPEMGSAIGALFSANSKVPFGAHAHDNKGSALHTTLAAMKSGAEMLDCTVLGMGRGAGNTQTESLLTELSILGVLEERPDGIAQLNQLIATHMQPLRDKYGWGPSLPYRLAADWGIHPTFVQELIQDGVVGARLVEALNKLRAKRATRFSPSLLNDDGESKKVSSVTSLSNSLVGFSEASLVIVGAGASAKKSWKEIERFIHRNDLVTFFLNTSGIGHGLGTRSFRVAAHEDRLYSQAVEFWEAIESKITPYRADGDSGKSPNDSVISRVVDPEQNRFTVSDDGILVPNDLTLTYALGVAAFLGFKSIFLAGVDGYESNDTRNAELETTIQQFQHDFPEVSMLSLTATRFSVNELSPYWRG